MRASRQQWSARLLTIAPIHSIYISCHPIGVVLIKDYLQREEEEEERRKISLF